MRIEKLWMVTDAMPGATLADICFETTLAALRVQFAGGLTMEQHPVLFATRDDAEREAHGRLVALRAARVITDLAATSNGLDGAARITLLDPDGKLLLDADLR